MVCPKCSTQNRDVARFCTRCHTTLRFKCPACEHEQRRGGVCEKCGVDFVKYATMLIVQRQSEHDLEHERLERRSGLLKSLVWAPLSGGISVFRYFFLPKKQE
jgi:hypothetical protein